MKPINTEQDMEQELKMSKEQIVKLFNEKAGADDPRVNDVCATLVQIFGTEYFRPADVRDRVKTFEDACKELGSEHQFVKTWESIYQGENDPDISDIADILAYHKLRIICAALNEGWEPQFTVDEQRYYPLHFLYDIGEVNRMPGQEISDMRLITTGGYQTEYAGFVCVSWLYSTSDRVAGPGSRLCLKDGSVAEYCGRQFAAIWADFLLIRKPKNEQE